MVKEEKSSEGIMSFSDDLSEKINLPTTTQWYGHYGVTNATLWFNLWLALPEETHAWYWIPWSRPRGWEYPGENVQTSFINEDGIELPSKLIFVFMG